MEITQMIHYKEAQLFGGYQEDIFCINPTLQRGEYNAMKKTGL